MYVRLQLQLKVEKVFYIFCYEYFKAVLYAENA